MSNTPLSSRAIERLRGYDTPTVCNVIELFGVRPRTAGYMDRRIQPCFPELLAMAGYAATGTFRSAAPARGDAYASLEQQVDVTVKGLAEATAESRRMIDALRERVALKPQKTMSNRPT